MLKLATAQFLVTNNIDDNLEKIIKLIKNAKDNGADLIHFPECALTGYYPATNSLNLKYEKNKINSSVNSLIEVSRINNIYIAIGSPMFSKNQLPYNSIIFISPKDNQIKQYNKRFLWADENKYFIQGKKLLITEINNIKIGFLICYEMNFFELIREYRKKGVNCILISLFSCFQKKINEFDEINQVIPIETISKYNKIWISISNHCNNISSWICDPNGVKKELPININSVEYTDINPLLIKKNKFDIDKDLFLIKNKITNNLQF